MVVNALQLDSFDTGSIRGLHAGKEGKSNWDEAIHAGANQQSTPHL